MTVNTQWPSYTSFSTLPLISREDQSTNDKNVKLDLVQKNQLDVKKAYLDRVKYYINIASLNNRHAVTISSR